MTHQSLVLEDEQALRALREGELDLRRTVILADGAPRFRSDCDTSRAQTRRRTLHEVEVEVDACASGHLVLTDAWAQGWRAEVNGVPTQVQRANYLLRAVEIPAGHSTVLFKYVPGAFRWGLVLSLVGLLAVVLLGRPPRRKPAPLE